MKKQILFILLLCLIPLSYALDIGACDYDYINISSNKTIYSVYFDDPHVPGLNISINKINSLKYNILIITSCDIVPQSFDFKYYIELDDEIIKKTYSSGIRYIYISNNTENNTISEGEIKEENIISCNNQTSNTCEINLEDKKQTISKYYLLLLIPLFIIILVIIYFCLNQKRLSQNKDKIIKYKTGGKK